METLPCGNGWKLMTTGGAAKAQVLDSCPPPPTPVITLYPGTIRQLFTSET